jgi:hypothetical protein
VSGAKKPKVEGEGIEELRRMLRVFNDCVEDFNMRYSFDELVKLYRAFRACGWEITPDEWTDRQVKEALRGKVPTWRLSNEEPFYGFTQAERIFLSRVRLADGLVLRDKDARVVASLLDKQAIEVDKSNPDAPCGIAKMPTVLRLRAAAFVLMGGGPPRASERKDRAWKPRPSA